MLSFLPDIWHWLVIGLGVESRSHERLFPFAVEDPPLALLKVSKRRTCN